MSILDYQKEINGIYANIEKEKEVNYLRQCHHFKMF